eukprot:CAMPEP_0183294544 /NCGR_PEP_ID=MMETSP0160_2-20130417/2847_1 /TAXON_ID=2839 ORGANISM="Odontella Sinensis, Strain Grunow 1884" /NCGR_SAMPLE_ID=MMETSP0160_2 /ASSEMBLY_ACC=CAM_ASM_000250 /LENGTH=75 /DNA_ID=CAMNT_0025455891 /DNA_START=301 /DNA_END=528 /DNA_ORIENTATION=-
MVKTAKPQSDTVPADSHPPEDPLMVRTHLAYSGRLGPKILLSQKPGGRSGFPVSGLEHLPCPKDHGGGGKVAEGR